MRLAYQTGDIQALNVSIVLYTQIGWRPKQNALFLDILIFSGGCDREDAIGRPQHDKCTRVFLEPGLLNAERCCFSISEYLEFNCHAK